MKNETKKLSLPAITIISRSGKNGLINKNSMILLDGKLINGLVSFSLEIDGDDPTGLPTVNIKLKGHAQVVQESEEENELASSSQG